MTMIDGKTRKILTDTLSFSRCTACDAVPNEMKVSTVLNRPVNTHTFKYGLSVLHATIRFLECVLHVSYRMKQKAWAVNKALISKRKKKIISRLREELGILVDTCQARFWFHKRRKHGPPIFCQHKSSVRNSGIR